MNIKMKKFILGALAISALFGSLFAMNDKGAIAATATTTCNNAVWSAVLSGNVYPNGAPTEAWFEWGENTGLPYQTPHQTYNSDDTHEQLLTPLAENTTYYYEIVVQNEYGSARGGVQSFSTGTCSNPVPKTQCSDGIDNDGDGKIDMADPYCTDPGDDDEREPSPQNCQDNNATNYGQPLPCQYPNNPNPTITPGTLSYQCLSNPTRVQLNWTSGQNANSNGIEKGDSYPNDPGAFWALISQPMSARSYTDTNVVPGNSYTYRIKYAPTVPSNEVVANCGIVLPPPPTIPTVNISANPSNVAYNGSSTVTWGSNNATSCTGTNGSSGWAGSKNLSGSFFAQSLTNTTTYTITCYNSAGVSATASTTVVVGNNNTCTDPLATNYNQPGPCVYNNQPNVTITADELQIDEGDSTTVRWTSTNATSCTGSNGRNGWAGSREIGNNRTFNTGSLSSDVTYTITCYNNAGISDTDAVTVRVDDDNNNNERPDVTTRPATDVDTDSATLNGRVDGNGSSVRAWFEYGTTTSMSEETSERSYGSGSTSYEADIRGLRPNTTYYFRAVAENSEDIVYGSRLTFRTDGDYIFPEIPSTRPTVVLTGDQTNLAYGGATTVRWYSTNATSCYGSGGSLGWAGTKNVGTGSFYTGSLTSSRTFSITCTNAYGSATDSVTIVVRGQVLGTTNPRPTGNALIILSTEVDRRQAIVASLDNTRPHPGDEINYTLKYQNVGNASATNLVLRLDLPYEVDYMYSTPSNPNRSGQTLIWSLGTLKAGASGTVSVRVRLRNDAIAGTVLNFPATLTYTDPSGYPQSVSANTSAIVWGDTTIINTNYNENYDSRVLGASVIGASFFPGSLFEWLLLLILILVLIVLIKYIFNQPSRQVVVTH